MSLINDVLRKMDQGGGGARAGSVPSNMTPPAEPPGRSPGRVAAAGGLLFLVGLGAGLGGWWLLAPPASPGGGVVPVEPAPTQRSQSPSPSGAEADRTPRAEAAGEAPNDGASGAPAEGKGQAAREGETASRPSPEEGPGPDSGSPSGDTELPPFSREMAEAAIAPPGEGAPATGPGSGERDSPEGAGGPDSGQRAGQSPSGGIEVKAPSRNPIKVVVRRPPEGTGSAGAESGAGNGEPGKGAGQGTEQGNAKTVAAKATEGASGDMRVRTPQGWEDSQRAGELARRGFRALGAQRYQRAVGLLERAQRLAPGRTDITNNLGLAQWQAGSRREAIRTLAAGLRSHPDNARMARNLAHFLLREEAPGREAGVRALEEALKAQRTLPLYALLGSVYRDMGRFGEAISLYQSGIASNGPNWRLLLGLGMALEGEGRHQKAVQVYERAREELPADLKKVRRSLDRRISSLDSVSG